MFKAVFASSDDLELLASLLSALLELDISENGLIITNAEIPPVYEEGKPSRLDVRVRTNDGRHINVEIQLRDEHNIEKRSLFYLSKLYTEQMVKGMDFIEICPAVVISVLGYNCLPFNDYHTRYSMCNIEKGHELTDVFELHFVELQKAPKFLHSQKDKWVRFLSAENGEVLEMLEGENPIFKKAIEKQVYASADAQLRYELDMREKAEMDYLSAMKTNYRLGREEGVGLGIEQGIEKGRIESIKALLESGMNPEEISKLLKYPIDKVNQVYDSLN